VKLKEFQKKVGQNIKRSRLAKGVTQSDMIDHGFTLRGYQYIEAGDRNLTLKTLLQLSKALGTTPSHLLKE
jgi:transcriptional regulator with XRE-family HTH domain